MARLSGRSKTLGCIFGVSATRTNTAGTASFHGLSTPKTHSVSTPPVSPPSSAYSVTNPHCSPGMGNHWKFQPWIFGSKRARGSGTQRTSSSSRQSRDTRPMPMPVVYLPRHTNLAIGCLRRTSVSGCPVPGLSVHSPSGGRSTRLLTSWTCHPPTVSHIPFTYPC